MLRLLRLFAFLALAVPGLRAGYVTDKPVRTEAEVRESGRQVVARYSDAQMVTYDPRLWLILRDGDRTIRAEEQFVLYQTGAAR